MMRKVAICSFLCVLFGFVSPGYGFDFGAVKEGQIVSQRLTLSGSRYIPLPPGAWKVLSVETKHIKITQKGGGTPSKPTQPLYGVFLANQNPDEFLIGLHIEFTLNAVLDWTTRDCEKVPGLIKNAHGTKVSSLSPKCTTIAVLPDLSRLAKNNSAPANTFERSYFSALSKLSNLPEVAISTYGHYAQHPRDLIQWAFFADPSKYGLNQMSDFPLSYDLQSTEGVRLLAGRTLLTDIARWNDLFLRALDGSFFGTLFSSPTEVIGFTTSTPIQQAISKSRRGITSEEPSVSTVNYSADAANSGGKVNLPKCDSAISFTRWTNCVGSITFNNGINWTGGWTDGMQDGFGKFTFVDGSTYIGELKNGKLHGEGTRTNANGDKYVGEYKDGKRNGQGTYYHSAENQWKGDKYVGEYKDDKRSGQGIYTFANGSPPKEGLWEDGKFVRAQRIPDHIAGRTSTAPVAQASRPVEAPRLATPLSLSASASQPSPDGVVTLSITTNNATASLKINGDEEGGRADGRYSVRKFAQVGENKFEVVAVDRSGNTQRQTVSVVRQPADNVARFAALNPVSLKARPPRDAVAIIIGIQDYRRVSKADFANNDARRFYDYAIRGLGVRPENIKLLLDDKADDIEILGAFKNWLPLKTRKGQTDVYVFYSGHGYPSDDGASLYFLPHGVDRQFLDRSAIKQSDIVQALQAVTPKSVTLFLDACYSGQSRTGETLLAGARPISIQPKASTFPSNFTVLSASAPEQIASSSPELKHGIFSYFLMKGMEGEADQNKDGVITVQEMQSYLSDSVGRKAMSLSRTQQPQVVGDQAKVLVGR